MSLNYEIARYTELTGQDGTKVPISRLGGYLDGYEKGREEGYNDAIEDVKNLQIEDLKRIKINGTIWILHADLMGHLNKLGKDKGAKE